MKFCSKCGSEEITWTVPEGDNRNRHVCFKCNQIYYQNPKIVTGCIPVLDDQVLLCRRAIEPRRGLWTLPAGFMENGETTAEGAARETLEEACCEVDSLQLYSVFNLPQINQVYMMFRAEMRGEVFSAGEESLECQLFTEAQIPWDSLAFPTITHTLKFFFEDRKIGSYKFHFGDIVREGQDTYYRA